MALGLLATCFSFCILTMAVLTAANAVFGTPDTLKQSLADSQTYDSVAAGIVDQAVANADKEQPQQAGEKSLDSKVAQDAMRKVVTPQRLRGYAEQVVEGTYNWLEGDTDKPDYAVDLSTIKKDLGVSVGDSAVQHLQELPVCTQQQLRKLNPNDVDPFALPCRPPGINLKAERQKLINQVIKGDGALQDTEITADDTISESGQTPFEKLAFIPTIFQWSKVLPWILGILAVVSATGVVFIQNDRRTGIKSVAKPLLATGLLLLVSIVVTSFLLGRLQFNEMAETRHFEEAMVLLIKSLYNGFKNVLLIFATIYTLLGASGLIGLRFTKPKGTAPENPHPRSPAEKPSSRPKLT